MRGGHKRVKQKRLRVADITCEYWTGLPSWPVTENKPQSRLVAIDSHALAKLAWKIQSGGPSDSTARPFMSLGQKMITNHYWPLRAINSWGLCAVSEEVNCIP